MLEQSRAVNCLFFIFFLFSSPCSLLPHGSIPIYPESRKNIYSIHRPSSSLIWRGSLEEAEESLIFEAPLRNGSCIVTERKKSYKESSFETISRYGIWCGIRVNQLTTFTSLAKEDKTISVIRKRKVRRIYSLIDRYDKAWVFIYSVSTI